MLTCSLCGCWLLSLSNYCNECHELRRLLLLHDKNNFLTSVKNLFLKSNDKPAEKINTDKKPNEKLTTEKKPNDKLNNNQTNYNNF
jgi:hypothetical protein